MQYVTKYNCIFYLLCWFCYYSTAVILDYFHSWYSVGIYKGGTWITYHLSSTSFWSSDLCCSYIFYLLLLCISKDYLCQFVHNIISQLLKLSILFHITVSSHCLRISYFIKFIILNIKFYSSSFVFLLKKRWTLDKRIHQISII